MVRSRLTRIAPVAMAGILCGRAFVGMLPATRSSLLQRSAGSSTDGAKVAFKELFYDDDRPIVLYDGVCNMCNSAVDVALQKDPDGRRLRFSALQSEVGRQLLVFCGRRAEDLSSMLVVKPDGECLSQSDAVVFVGQQLEGSSVLQGLSKAAQALVPKPLRDGAYNVVAKNRYRVLGRRTELRLKQDGMEDRFVNRESKPAVEGA
ncbi:yuxK [Symbiodinium necroappetens]|uniref:YuxK protein n=2 Tax=Symbiodinium TaxID=2949 RepID=A0A812N3E8_9DINO|nr:DCC family protein, chloroplastic [Symbiodinium microadriaticum]CAE7300132.1 yuxK [Symbiodinium necroappetens]